MLARFLHSSKADNYENHRSKPYQETTCGVGIHRALRPQAVHAETKLDNIKAQGTPSKEIAERLSCSEPKFNRWVKRYLAQGVDGLRSKPGQEAKLIMDSSDKEAVRLAIEKDRLSVMKAKERWQQATGKEACRDTYRAFLSALAQDLDVSGRRPNGHPRRRSTLIRRNFCKSLNVNRNPGSLTFITVMKATYAPKDTCLMHGNSRTRITASPFTNAEGSISSE